MKKAVIATGGKQYLVSEGEELDIERTPAGKTIEFDPLLIIDGERTSVGQPHVSGSKVTAEIVEQAVKGEKVVAIRYKAKKRVRKVRGHRQTKSRIKVLKIS